MIRQQAGLLMSRLLKHPLHGARIDIVTRKILPTGLVASLTDDPPEIAVALLDEQCESPDRVWTAEMSREISTEILRLADSARA